MRVIIGAAGTAGHINPGIAIANKIKKEEPDSDILFIGTSRGLEHDLTGRAGYKLKTIEAYGFKKELSIKNIKRILSTIKSIKETKKIIDDFKPDVVIGTGGYICGPVFMSAKSRNIPTILHESNAHPGKTVKLLEENVDKILVGFEETKNKISKAKKVIVTGTPTKIQKLEISQERKEEILKELNIKNNFPIVLVYGGSQGAQKINDALEEILIEKLNKEYQIIWATGTKQYDEIKEKFEKLNININNINNVKIIPYIYNMEELMNLSDLLICRSGAMTITEIAIVGKPAIFIPLPSKSANRQEDNARVMENIGAAKIILNKNLNGKILAKQIDEIIGDKQKMEEMGRKALKIAKYNVEDKIYREIKELILTNTK